MPEPVVPTAGQRFLPSVPWRLAAALMVVLFTAGLWVGGAAPLAVGLFKPPWDKLAHIGSFTLIGMALGLSSGARGWRLWLFTLVGVLAVGGLDELHQLRLPGRHAGWDDLAANALGGLLGAWLLGRVYRGLDGLLAEPAWPQRWRQLLSRLQLVSTAQAEVQLLQQLGQPQRPTMLGFVNAHAMNSAAGSASFYEALASADTLLRDGSGMAALCRLLGVPAGHNLNGTDFIPRLLDRFKGRTIALLGTRAPFLDRAAVAVGQRLGNASRLTTAEGFLPLEDYVTLLQAQPCALIVLGMGMPRQEALARQLRAQLGYPCLIVCGGAILDFWGGKTARAPVWMRRLGLEWVYRLAQEPARLGHRYVLGNPLFLARAWRLRLRQRT